MPLSKIKTCLFIEKELKFGIMETILDIIVRLSSWKIKQNSNMCLLSSMSPQKQRSLLDKLMEKL